MFPFPSNQNAVLHEGLLLLSLTAYQIIVTVCTPFSCHVLHHFNSSLAVRGHHLVDYSWLQNVVAHKVFVLRNLIVFFLIWCTNSSWTQIIIFLPTSLNSWKIKDPSEDVEYMCLLDTIDPFKSHWAAALSIIVFIQYHSTDAIKIGKEIQQ